MAKANAQWAKVGKNLEPLVESLKKLDEALATGANAVSKAPAGRNVIRNGLHGGWMNGLITGNVGGATTAYTIPGISAATSQSQAGATLASFVQGNQQSTFLSDLQKALGLGGSGSGGGGGGTSGGAGPQYQNAGWSTPGGTASVSRMQSKYGSTISRDISRMKGHSPLLTPELVEAMGLEESGGYQHAANGHVLTSSAGALGIMQLMPGTAAALGVNPDNAGSNLQGGIAYINQLLEQFGNVSQALSAYNAGPGAVPGNGLASGTQNYVSNIEALLTKIEKNTRSLKGSSKPPTVMA